MPRKPQPKCIYCRGSKLTSECFEVVLVGFLGGMSSEECIKFMKTIPHRVSEVPSEKTVRRHFRLIGDYLFENFAEPRLRGDHVQANALKQSSPAEYEELTNKVLLLLHDAIITGDAEVAHEHYDLAKTYKYLSSKKYGIKNSMRENFALACLHHHYMGALTGQEFEMVKAEAVKKYGPGEESTIQAMRFFHDGLGMAFVTGAFEFLKIRIRETPL